MITKNELKELAEISAGEKTFLSIYLPDPGAAKHLDSRLGQKGRALKSKSESDGVVTPTEKDELEHFAENVRLVNDYLTKNPLKSGGLCIFSCWALDFFRVYPLTLPVKDEIWFDSSPYIRPLAELMDEYENAAVVIADNKKARIFMVTSATPGEESTISGDIKNHVRKGGWSQQRYERRRDKQLLLYAREIAAALAELEKTENFQRIILVGGKEILRILYENLPKRQQGLVLPKAIDLNRAEDVIFQDIMELFFEKERESERELWDKIRTEYLRDGLGVAGLEDVLNAVSIGQVEEIIVNRDFHAQGKRCRSCENLEITDVTTCSKCGSDSLFDVDVVNEIVELGQQTGASTDFCEPLDSLREAGNIAAFLRYRLS